MSEIITIDQDAAAFARHALLEWHDTAGRSFSWRGDTDPYHILIAEMMLRRTQDTQLVPVYHRFLNRFPDIASLDLATDSEVAKMLRPLGLNWRADNFKVLAHEIMTRHQGKIPYKREELLALTGVGPYVADAIRSFAFHEPSVIMDTNTVRVAARYFGFDYDAESRRRKSVIQAVSHLVTQREPARSNYALLDFAALICRSRHPLHNVCPLASRCVWYQKNADAETRKNSIPAYQSENVCKDGKKTESEGVL